MMFSKWIKIWAKPKPLGIYNRYGHLVYDAENTRIIEWKTHQWSTNKFKYGFTRPRLTIVLAPAQDGRQKINFLMTIAPLIKNIFT
jgi:hypothetical protein